jgi:DNA-binding MarR family transcriptional regulator
VEYPVTQSEGERVPLAVIFSDSETGERAASGAVQAAGGRIAASLDLGAARGRLSSQIGMDLIVVDLSRDHGNALDHLLDQLDAIGTRDAIPSVIAMPPELIDMVCARIQSDHVTMLCAPDPIERVSALSCAWMTMPSKVGEINADLDNVRLRRLADEVTRIARALANLSGTPAARSSDLSPNLQSHLNDVQSGFSAQPATLFAEPMPDAAEIRTVLRLRRLRDNFFESVLFADPAWDMLLDLMAARLEGDKVAVSSLCIAAAVPPTTALRWIKAMTDHNLFERESDPTDGRRIFIRLSDEAASGIARYFAAAKRIGGIPV